MLDLLKDSYNCFLLSLIEKHLNEPIIYNNFSFSLRKVFGTYQAYYTILLAAFEFVFILKHIFCLPQWLIFEMACRVWLNRSWFMIHIKVLNFHKFLCYHKSIELPMGLWHLNNMKAIITLWTLNCWVCSFFLYWLFPYCSQLSQLI